MQRIGGVTRGGVLSVAEGVMKRFLELPENRNSERTGGYLTILHKRTGKRYFINEIGECLAKMDRGCFLYSQEKSDRLRARNATDGHISAWQSRSRGDYEYGGAIVAPDDSAGLDEGRDLIGSFSGTYEHGEEVVLLIIWMIFRWMTLEDARKITAISGNQLLDPMLNACNDLFDRKY